MIKNKRIKKIVSIALCVMLCGAIVTPVSLAKADSLATLKAGDVKVFYSEEKDAQYSGEYESYGGGLVVAGTTDYVITLGTINLNEFNGGTTEPLFRVSPYFGDGGMDKSKATFEKNAPCCDFYVDFVSVANPNRKLSFKFGTRTSDSTELNIAVAGDNIGYASETWASTTAKKYQRWGNGSAMNTQMFSMASQSERNIFYDRYGYLVTAPHPIAIYYDNATNTTYTDTGVYDEKKNYTKLRESKNGDYRYRILEMTYNYATKNGTVKDDYGIWTPFTEQEKEQVKIVVRFGRAVNTDIPCKLVFYTIAGEVMEYPSGDSTVGEVWSQSATHERVSYSLTYTNGGVKKARVTYGVGEVTENTVEDPVREGFVFAGWYNGDTEFVFGEANDEDITLTAKWYESCPKCQTQVFEGTENCSNCGSQIDSSGEVATDDGAEKKEKSGCGKEAISLLAFVTLTLGATLVDKR